MKIVTQMREILEHAVGYSYHWHLITNNDKHETKIKKRI